MRPYRVFFPLGALLGAVGVSHWLLYTLGLESGYSNQRHAFIQIEAFLFAYAAGFMMTMVPRRTQTPPATTGELAAIIAGLITVAAASWAEAWIVSQTAFLAVLVLLIRFAVRRFTSAEAGRRPPAAFILVPIGLAHGLVGGLATLLAATGTLGPWAMAIGRTWIQEGMFLCLILGIGDLVVPLLTGYDVPDDVDASDEARAHRRADAILGIVIFSSFILQHLVSRHVDPAAGVRAGNGLRLVLVLYQVIFRMRAYRRPAKAGLQRTFLWISVWMVPLGLALLTAFPRYRVAFLHVLFVGGFGLMVFSVGAHVIFAHGDFPDLVRGRPWPVRTFGLLFLFAMLTRVSADFLPESYWAHIGGAAAAWLTALAVWMVYLVPKVLRDGSGGGREAGAS
jgi:uncharacterized protein involved in response to NO